VEWGAWAHVGPEGQVGWGCVMEEVATRRCGVVGVPGPTLLAQTLLTSLDML